MADYGFTEDEARAFLEKELRRHAASTSFYWESEETEEVLDLLTEVVAKLISAKQREVGGRPRESLGQFREKSDGWVLRTGPCDLLGVTLSKPHRRGGASTEVSLTAQ